MCPIKSISTLDEMQRNLNGMISPFICEQQDISEQWACLGIAGGQREDHAAKLLSRLRPHLHGIAEFCRIVESQITAMVADPFADE